jgi:hypothetical protein
VDGKYIKPSAKDSGLASIGALCDPAQFAKSFGGDMTGMVKGATTTIAGQPALQYNAPLHLSPPPASQVLDGAKYGF